MPIFSEQDKQKIKQSLERIKNPVKLIFFTQNVGDCQYCDLTEQMLKELCELNPKLSYTKYNLVLNKDEAEKFGVDKVPAIVVCAANNGNVTNYGIKFFGIPSGYEFATLLEDIIMVSSNESGLSPQIKEKLSFIDDDVRIQVFVTPTCPYCPQAVFTAHRFALESPKVTSDMVEATEFPDLVAKYAVNAVPKIVINDAVEFEGLVPEDVFVEQVLQAVQASLDKQSS